MNVSVSTEFFDIVTCENYLFDIQNSPEWNVCSFVWVVASAARYLF